MCVCVEDDCGLVVGCGDVDLVGVGVLLGMGDVCGLCVL